MITFSQHLNKKKGKEIIIYSHEKKFKGILEIVRKDYLLLKRKNRKTPSIIQLNRVILVEEVEA